MPIASRSTIKCTLTMELRTGRNESGWRTCWESLLTTNTQNALVSEEKGFEEQRYPELYGVEVNQGKDLTAGGGSSFSFSISYFII